MLAEIQRLKEEANRFISILAEEDDPEKANELLSPGKRQSLTREVESLQVRFQFFQRFVSSKYRKHGRPSFLYTMSFIFLVYFDLESTI